MVVIADTVLMRHWCTCEAEHDPEDVWAGEALGLEDTDEELVRPAKRYSQTISSTASQACSVTVLTEYVPHTQHSMPSRAELGRVCRPASKEKGLRLRGAIELDEQEYAGRTSSRKAIFGEDAMPASSTGLGCAWQHRTMICVTVRAFLRLGQMMLA